MDTIPFEPPLLLEEIKWEFAKQVIHKHGKTPQWAEAHILGKFVFGVAPRNKEVCEAIQPIINDLDELFSEFTQENPEYA